MMDIKTSEKVLRAMLKIKQNDCLDNPLPDLSKELPDLSEDVLLAVIADFEQHRLIKALYGDDTVQCIVVQPLAIGYLRKIEEDREKEKSVNTPGIQQNFNFQNNYGAVGTNSHFTINNTFDFEEFDRLIKQNTVAESADRKALEELQEQLKLVTQHNIPISKGYLSKFNDIMQKHSWVTGPLAGFLLHWIAG